MNEADQIAIAEFLKGGGRIRRLDDPVPVTEQEVIAYLRSCGFRTKYFPGDVKPYLCDNKRMSVHGLFDFANKHRRAQTLPRFAIRG